MSNWRELEDEMSDLLSAEFAEAVTIIHMRKGDVNSRSCEDPERPAYATRGIFEWMGKPLEFLKGRDRSATPPAAFHASREPTVSFEKRDLQYALREGDLIVMTERDDLTFELRSPMPDGHGRVHWSLNQRGNAPL